MTHQCGSCPQVSGQYLQVLKDEIRPRQFNQSFFACDKHLGEVVKKAVLVFGPVEVKDV